MKKQEVEKWYKQFIAIVDIEDLQTRYRTLVQLHSETTHKYISELEKITKEMAAEASSDGRPIALVVAHIMAWEEWQIQIFGDQNKLEKLQEQMKLQGYYDTDTRKTVNFQNVDDFNGYTAKSVFEKPVEKLLS